MKFFLVFCFALMISLIGCSSSDITDGGTATEGESFIYGSLEDTLGNEVSDALVTLQKISISDDGSVISDSLSTHASSDGSYSFSNLDSGTYILLSQGKNAYEGHSSVESQINFTGDSLKVKAITLRSSLSLRGNIPNFNSCPTQLSVFIPGVTPKQDVDSLGHFYWSELPQGRFELAILCGKTIQYLPLKMSQNCSEIELPDINLVHDDSLSDFSYPLYPNRLEHSVIMNHQGGGQGQNKKCSGLEFQGLQANQLLPTWNIPFKVWISSSHSFDSNNDIKKLIQPQIGSVGQRINQSKTLPGIIHLNVDTIQSYSTSLAELKLGLNSEEFHLILTDTPSDSNITRTSIEFPIGKGLLLEELPYSDLGKKAMVYLKLAKQSPSQITEISIDQNQINAQGYTSKPNFWSDSPEAPWAPIDVWWFSHSEANKSLDSNLFITALEELEIQLIDSQSSILSSTDYTLYPLVDGKLSIDFKFSGSTTEQGFLDHENVFNLVEGHLSQVILLELPGANPKFAWIDLNDITLAPLNAIEPPRPFILKVQ